MPDEPEKPLPKPTRQDWVKAVQERDNQVRKTPTGRNKRTGY